MQTRETISLIQKAQSGDLRAFTSLVRSHQDMAFAYAYSILGDFHLAQDATQDTFLCVHACLPTLRSPDAFPGWLRGIVRHRCARLCRNALVPCVSLELAAEAAAQTPGPETQWEQHETQAEVMAAVRALPPAQREVVSLFYIQDYSIFQIAAFLEVPGTTVKNRLHQARITLRRRMLPMIKETLQAQALPEEFAQRVGRIVQVQGPFVEAEFALDEVPALLSGLTVQGGAGGAPLVVEVVQHLGEGRVRGVVLLPLARLIEGGAAVSTGRSITQPISPEALDQVLREAGGHSEASPKLLETGIKAIDLLCPFAEGGSVGFFGDSGVGKAALVSELLHNLAAQPSPLTFFAFVDSHDEAALLVKNADAMPASAEKAQTLFLPTDDPADAALGARLGVLDSILYLTKDLAVQGIFPAIDPVLSTSRLLDPVIVGQEHIQVAAGVRDLLRQLPALQGKYALTETEKTLMARARRVQLFLSQPFFVAEPFTQVPGVKVPLSETLAGFSALLSGEHDHLPEEAFLMTGSLAGVIEKSERLAKTLP
jgi:RNA polymerase sigma factor (sigma-70 family)